MVSVLAVASRAVLGACEKLGLDGDNLLREARLTRAELEDPESRIEADQADALWLAAYAATGDPALALHAAEQLQPRSFPMLHYLFSASPTLGAGIESMARYFELVDGRARLEVEVDGHLALVRMLIPGSPGGVHRPAAEFTLAATLLQSRAVAIDWRPRAVDFEFPEPEEAAEHRRVFGAPVFYGQAHTQLRIGLDAWSARLPGADPQLRGILEAHAARVVRELPDDAGIRTTVRGAIAVALREGREVGIGFVAARLGLGERTLQRRLADAGYRFGDLVDEVRETSARRLLSDPGIGIGEITWLLGFSEQSAFTRAFKRWTGSTPTKFREGIVRTRERS